MNPPFFRGPCMRCGGRCTNKSGCTKRLLSKAHRAEANLAKQRKKDGGKQ